MDQQRAVELAAVVEEITDRLRGFSIQPPAITVQPPAVTVQPPQVYIDTPQVFNEQPAPSPAPEVTVNVDLRPVAAALQKFAEQRPAPPDVRVSVDLRPVAAALEKIAEAQAETNRILGELLELGARPRDERASRTVTVAHSDGSKSVISWG